MKGAKAALRVPPAGTLGGEAADIVGVYGVAEVVRAAGLSRFGSRGAMTCHPVEYGQGEPPQQPPPPLSLLRRSLSLLQPATRSVPTTKSTENPSQQARSILAM